MAKTLQHQIIEGALDLIAEEEHWTRCSMARNREGDPCSVWSPGAVRYCALGALWRAANELAGTLDAFRLVEAADCRNCPRLFGHARLGIHRSIRLHRVVEG